MGSRKCMNPNCEECEHRQMIYYERYYCNFLEMWLDHRPKPKPRVKIVRS